MPITLANRVKETSLTSGSGTISLNGASAGYQAFSGVLSSGDTTYYTITNSDAWEVGIGTFGSATLTRDTILSSSNSNAKINLSGQSNVFIAYPSEKSVYKDADDKVVVGSSGIILSVGTPSSTANTLYVTSSGTLFFNGSGVGGGGGGGSLNNIVEDTTPQLGGNLDLNTYNATGVGSIDVSGNITAITGIYDTFDLTSLEEASQPAHQEGRVFYDVDNHALVVYNDESEIAQQIGQEGYIRVRNNTGYTIFNGSGVRITGSHGNSAPTIDYAIATGEATSRVMGLATHDIENNSFGYITTFGIVRRVDTSSFSAGDELYLSATSSGGFVNTSPVIPNYSSAIGYVIRSHNDGEILVDLGKHKLGGGDVKSINGAVTMSGVPFVGQLGNTNGAGLSTTSVFVYDSGNGRLGIGISTPAYQLDVVGTGSFDTLNVNDVYTFPTGDGTAGHSLVTDGAGNIVFSGVSGGGTTYTAGTGLVLVGDEFNIDSTVVQSGDNISLLVNNSGYINEETDTLSTVTGRGSSTTTSCVIPFYYDNTGVFPSATTYHGAIAHSHANGGMFFAHAGDWIRLAQSGDNNSIFVNNSNYTASGDNISKFVNDSGYLNAHPSISAASSSDNSGQNFIQDILLDSNGHVTGIAVAAASGSGGISNVVEDTTPQLGGDLDVNDNAIQYSFDLTGSSSPNYTFAGGNNFFNSTANDPTLYLTRGVRYDFTNIPGSHPFRIQSVNTAGGTLYSTGVTNNGGTGTVSFIPPMDAPDELYYYCSNHSSMNGTIHILGADTDTDTTYTAGTGLTLSGTEFNIDATVLQSGDNISLLVNDSGYINAEINDLSSVVTWTNVPDANITQSSVIQHSGAINITESQIVDLQSYLTEHPNISAASSSDNSGRTYVQDVLLDSNGHVTGIATATETVTDTNTTYTAGSGLTLNGTTFDANVAATVQTESPQAVTTSSSRTYSVQVDSNDNLVVNVPWTTGVGGGGISNIVEDTSPQLGGNLDLNSSSITGVGEVNITGSGTFTGVITASGGNSTQWNTAYGWGDHSSQNYVASGNNISLLVNNSGYLNAHPTISAASSSDNSGRTYVQDILLDSNGHVTGIATATETVTDTDTTYTAGTGLNLDGTEFNIDATVIQSGDNISLLVNNSGYINAETNDLSSVVTWANVPDANITQSSVVQHSGALEITESQIVDLQSYLTAHPNISAASSSDNAGRTYIQDLLLDSNGHVTGIATATETVTDTDTTYTAGTGLSLSGTEFNIDATVMQSGDNISLLVNDSGYTNGAGVTNYVTKWSTTDTLTSGVLYDNGSIGIVNSDPDCRLTLGDNISGVTNNGISVNMGGTGKPAFTAIRETGDPVFSILVNTSQVYLSAGAFYNGSSWQHRSDDDNNCIFVLDPPNGTYWYAGNNGSSILNVSNQIKLWDANSYWKSAVQSTYAEDSYFTGGNLGVGTTSPALQSAGKGLHIHATGNHAEIKFTNAVTNANATDGVALVSSSSSFTINNREAGAMSLNTNNTNAIYIDSAQRVGLGNQSPGCVLDVTGTGCFTALKIKDQYIFPTGDGTAGHSLVTDGAGNIVFSGVSGGGGGGIDNVVEDTTPQLGGDLDLNSSSITGVGSIQITGSGTFTDSIGIGIASPEHKLDVVYPDSGCVRFADPSGSGIMIGDCALSSNADFAGMQHTKMVGSYMIVSNGDDTYISARDTQSVFIRGGGNDANSEISIHDVGIGGVGIIFNEQGADRDIRMEGVSDNNLFRLDASTNRIGIGTNAPAYKLDVSGTLSADSVNVNNAYTFPTGDGTAGHSLVTDGAGSIVFSGVSGGGGGGLDNVVEDTSPQLGGNLDLNSKNITGTGHIDITGSGNFTHVEVSGNIEYHASKPAITTDSDGATITFNMDTSDTHTVVLGGNRTLALSNTDAGQKFIIRLTQDGTGGRTVNWFSTIKWPGGLEPTLTATADKTDVFGFICTSAGNYDGFVIGYNL